MSNRRKSPVKKQHRPVNNQQNNNQQVQVTEHQSFAGPLPPPVILSDYENVLTAGITPLKLDILAVDYSPDNIHTLVTLLKYRHRLDKNPVLILNTHKQGKKSSALFDNNHPDSFNL